MRMKMSHCACNLDAHLSLLRRQELIADWHDRQILAGEEWAHDIDEYLKTASIILLLISPDFLASDYCYDIEMQRALERHHQGEVRVIPIILRPVDWHSAPFGRLQCLPLDGKPLTKWTDRDDGWFDVITGIRKILKEIQEPPHPTVLPPSPVSLIYGPNIPEKAIQHDNILDDWSCAGEFAELMDLLTDIRQWGQAEATAYSVRGSDNKIRTLRQLASKLVEAKEWVRAEAVARSIEDSQQSDRALSELAKELAEAGEWVRAETVARSITESDMRAQVLTKVRRASIKSGQPFRARGLAFAPPRRQENRVRMLKCVRMTWINGVLERSLHRAALIELGLQEQPDALANPWRLEVQETDLPPCPLPVGTSIQEVYDQADGELLLLGEPGAGKTTLLLELARTLLEWAEIDGHLPIPVLFNLSSWAEKRQSLGAWLVEELQTKYWVPRKIGQAWVDADLVLPLLDGLDEVTENVRSACVQQINNYYQSRLESGGGPIVVCCRSEEYTALSTRVMLQHAVSILPLTNEQINTYLEQAGGQVKGLRQALDEDVELRSLARQPLMLNIFMLAYQGATLAEVSSGKTPEETRQAIFAKYVECMLNRRGKSKLWKPEQMIRWLIFLAKQMQRHNQTVFSVENLQPTWLPRRWRLLYHWCAGLPFGLLFGLIGGLSTGLSGRQLSERLTHSPNEGTWRSGKNGLLALLAGLLAGLLTGLEAFVLHFFLRFLLSWQGGLPWNLVPFLDEAVGRLLLRRVGGSYIFVHRLLLDYFTTLDESVSAESPSSTANSYTNNNHTTAENQ